MAARVKSGLMVVGGIGVEAVPTVRRVGVVVEARKLVSPE